MATTEEPTPIYDQLVKEFAARVAFEHFFGPDKEDEEEITLEHDHGSA